VGEGGEIERSEIEPGEGLLQQKGARTPRGCVAEEAPKPTTGEGKPPKLPEQRFIVAAPYAAAVVTPPSTTMVWPVMKVDASEAR
jgi:hypothetical protein